MNNTIKIEFGEDYPFKGKINNFEKYMFATTENNIKKHYSFENEKIYLLDDRKMKHSILMNNIENRKKAIDLVNTTLLNLGYESLESKYFSVFLIDFYTDKDEYDLSELNNLYQYLENLMTKWCIENNRFITIAQHFHQFERVPHIHIIYTRNKRYKHNELQEYLISQNLIQELLAY